MCRRGECFASSGAEHAPVDHVLHLGMVARDLRDACRRARDRSGCRRTRRRRNAARGRAARPASSPSARRRVRAMCRRSSALAFSTLASSCASRSGAEPAAPIASSDAATVALASAPFSWPPMPSATAQTPNSGRSTRLSSLASLTRPAWLIAPVSNGADARLASFMIGLAPVRGTHRSGRSAARVKR